MSGLALIGGALGDALRQLPSAAFLKLLAGALAVTLVVTGPFLALFAAIAWLVELLTPASLSLPWLGEVSFLGVFTQGLVSKTAWVFWTYVMAPLAIAVMGLFLESVVEAVEARHYPALAPVRRRPWLRVLGQALWFFLLMLAVSLGALIASLFAGFLAPLVFVAANGYLIGREYYETVALRRLGEAEARRRTRQHLPLLWALGAVLAVALNLPWVNLAVPLVGVAAYTHLFHRLEATGGPGSSATRSPVR